MKKGMQVIEYFTGIALRIREGFRKEYVPSIIAVCGAGSITA